MGAVALFQMDNKFNGTDKNKHLFMIQGAPKGASDTLLWGVFRWNDDKKEYIYIFFSVYTTLDNYKSHKFSSQFFKIQSNEESNNWVEPQ